MAKRPWRAHYTRDWHSDPFVRELDLEARMVYLELLDIAWDEGGIRLDWIASGTYIPRRIGCSRRKFEKIWPSIRAKFAEISPGFLSNPKLENERLKSDLFSEKQSNRAKQKNTHDAAAKHGGRHPALPLTVTVTSTTQSQSESTYAQASPGAGQFDQGLAFDAIWKAYPRKMGSKAARRHFSATVKNEKDLERIYAALSNFIAQMTAEQRPAEKVPYGSTWFNNWQDWLDVIPFSPRGIASANHTHPKPAPHNETSEDVTDLL